MISKTLLPWILLLCLNSALCDIELYGSCKIHHLDGTCIPITSCKFALTILSINDVQTLRTMFCGFEGSVPKVCCPVPNTYEKPKTTEPTPKIPTTRIIPTTRKIPTTTSIYDYKINDIEVVTTRKPPPPTVDPFVLPSRAVCGQLTDGDRIYGGQIAAIDEFPWLARIKYYIPTRRQELYACSGSLINERYVLTAAHCLNVYKALSVRLGEWDTETDIDCQDDFCIDPPLDVKVENIIIYPGYDKKNMTSGDIALLRLEHPVKFTDFVRPVCLPTTDYIARQDYIDSTYTTAGWGKTEFGQESILKRKVNLDSVPYSICTAAITGLPKIDDPHVICAGGKKGMDSCRGDSGGPLLRVVQENYKQNWHLYGITSYGVSKCGTAGKPGVYTRVTKYMDWILQTISGG